jgi:hypothetical protein
LTQAVKVTKSLLAVQTPAPHSATVPDSIVEMIAEWCYSPEVSYEAANRVITIFASTLENPSIKKKQLIPVRYWNFPQSSVYHTFVTTHRDRLIAAWGPANAKKLKPQLISETKFWELGPVEMKEPHKETDKCPVCVHGFAQQDLLEDLLAKYGGIELDPACGRLNLILALLSQV